MFQIENQHFHFVIILKWEGLLMYKENCKNPAEFGLLSTWNSKETGQNCVLTLEFLLCPSFFQVTVEIDTLSLQAAGEPGWAALPAWLSPLRETCLPWAGELHIAFWPMWIIQQNKRKCIPSSYLVAEVMISWTKLNWHNIT